MAKPAPRMTPAEIKEVIAVAWDDRPPFYAVLRSHGLSEGQVVALLKRELTPNAYKTWQARVRGAAPAQRTKPASPASPSRPLAPSAVKRGAGRPPR